MTPTDIARARELMNLHSILSDSMSVDTARLLSQLLEEREEVDKLLKKWKTEVAKMDGYEGQKIGRIYISELAALTAQK